MHILNDANTFGFSSLGCPFIAIDIDENPISGKNPEYIKEFLLEVFGYDNDTKREKQRTIDEIDIIIQRHLKYISSDKKTRENG